jgi:hypothetical protein
MRLVERVSEDEDAVPVCVVFCEDAITVICSDLDFKAIFSHLHACSANLRHMVRGLLKTKVCCPYFMFVALFAFHQI